MMQTSPTPIPAGFRFLALCCAVLVGGFPVSLMGSQKPASAAGVSFDRDIRPILSDNCFACHGPDEKARKSKLRFDLKEEAFKAGKSGKIAIVPGDVHQSELIHRITTKDADDVMPPVKSGKKLTAAQLDLLKRWVAEGAVWKSHWAYEKPARPVPPEVKDAKWPKNEIDHFVLKRLEKEGIKHSPEAEKTTLIRRATYDLTGLPPTPQEVDAFLSEKTPEAYDALVNRLLSSPRYGEQMARSWLDAARYADSHGYHIDSERSIWKWRDWVIKAFNDNLPYDRFGTMQIAGDLLPDAGVAEKTASGYVRCNMSTGEGGAITEEYQAKYTFDRTETTSTIFLGLTMTCARCHTHKYDPISHKEYYQLFSFFNNLNEAVMDGNQPNPDPFIKIPTPKQAERTAWLKAELEKASNKFAGPDTALDTAEKEWRAGWRAKLASSWSSLKPERVDSTNGPVFKTLDDHSVLVSGTNSDEDVYELVLNPGAGKYIAIRLEALPDASLPKKSAARSEDGKFRLGEFEVERLFQKTDGTAPGVVKLPFEFAVADSNDGESDAAKAIDGKKETGWTASTIEEPHAAVFLFKTAVALGTNETLRVRMRFDASKSKRSIGHFRLSLSPSEVFARLLTPPKPPAWQVIGPFPSEGLPQGLAKVYEPEKAIDLKKKYTGVREEIGWHEEPKIAEGKSHLFVDELHGVHGTYYFTKVIRSTRAGRGEIALDADQVFRVWLNGKVVGERISTDGGKGTVRLPVEIKEGENVVLVKVVNQVGASNFKFALDFQDPGSLPPATAGIFATSGDALPSNDVTLRKFFRIMTSSEFKELAAKMDSWKEEQAAIEREIPTTMVAKENETRRDTFMLMRGEYDKKGDKVEPGVPAILPPLPPDAPRNRLGLAQWMFSPNHPLTARVTVNRLWQQVFGVGLVKTTEDFGVQGERPSHPELLDWLATELIQSGWDVKHIMKLMLTSATYRQSSKLNREILARDPENRLLAHGPRFRLEAEVIRDTALSVGGLLAERRGGRSVKPFEPPGLWEAVSYNNAQKYVPDSGESSYRRSLYTYWKRQSPPPSMLLFDAPTREFCTVRRPRSNTPLQALVLLNDPQFVEASRGFAARILSEGGESVRERIEYGFRLATARKPTASERSVLEDVLKRQMAEYKKDPAAAEKYLSVGAFKPAREFEKAELAAWCEIASMLLNLDETLTKG